MIDYPNWNTHNNFLTKDLIRESYRCLLLRDVSSETEIEQHLSMSFDQLKKHIIYSDEYAEKYARKIVLPPQYIELHVNLNNFFKLRDSSFRGILLNNYLVSLRYNPQLLDLTELKSYGSLGLVEKDAFIKQEKLFNNLCDRLLNGKQVCKIPHVHHRIWITSIDDAYEVPKIQLTNYLQSLNTLSEKSEWTHYFWCWDSNLIPETIEILKTYSIKIEIMNLQEYIPNFRSQEMILDLYKKKTLRSLL